MTERERKHREDADEEQTERGEKLQDLSVPDEQGEAVGGGDGNVSFTYGKPHVEY